eukprot:jgi/Hompol1/4601/HPOL_003740-RA
MTSGPNGVELVQPPADGISSVAFSSISKSLLATVTLLDAAANTLCTRYSGSYAVLDVSFNAHSEVVYSAGIDRSLSRFDVASESLKTLGVHEDTIRSVEYSSETGQVVTGGWDNHVKLWDDRAAEPLSESIAQPDKVHSISITHSKLVVALAGRQIHVYDLRSMAEPLQRRESSLKFMTRKVACIPNGQGFASSSTEGRIAVEYFDLDAQSKNYSFKCHRQVVDGTELIYPVNTLAYHPVHGTFASGGSDGIVNIWDGYNKKRIKQFSKYPTSISSLAFNRDGSLLAVASSYTFDEGEREPNMGSIYSRLYDTLFPKKDMRILMLGLESAGKSTTAFKLRLGDITTTTLTIGTNVETARLKNLLISICDVGGFVRIQTLARSYD